MSAHLQHRTQRPRGSLKARRKARIVRPQHPTLNRHQGERAAGIYGLIGTAKLNGLNPEAYLREVLSRIADHPMEKCVLVLADARRGSPPELNNAELRIDG